VPLPEQRVRDLLEYELRKFEEADAS